MPRVLRFQFPVCCAFAVPSGMLIVRAVISQPTYLANGLCKLISFWRKQISVTFMLTAHPDFNQVPGTQPSLEQTRF